MLTLEDLRERISDKPGFVMALDAWERARGNQIVPRQTDLTVEKLGDAARSLLIFEVQAPDRVIYRRYPRTDRDFYVEDRTGKNIISLTTPRHREAMMRQLWCIAQRPCTNTSSRLIRTRFGAQVFGHYLSLPVAAAQEGEPMLIYSTAFLTERIEANLFEDYSQGLPANTDNEYFDIGNGTEPVPFPTN
jgi:hypothetical protein